MKYFQISASEKFARAAFAAAGIDYDKALAAKNVGVLNQSRATVSGSGPTTPSRSKSHAGPSAALAPVSSLSLSGSDRARASFQKDADAIAAKIYPPRGK